MATRLGGRSVKTRKTSGERERKREREREKERERKRKRERERMPTTAYFAFSAANRDAVREDLQEERRREVGEEKENHEQEKNEKGEKADGVIEDGDRKVPKLSVADVARELGKRWRALSADEQEMWKNRAKEQDIEKNGKGVGINSPGDISAEGNEQAQRGKKRGAVGELPLARLKKMIV